MTDSYSHFQRSRWSVVVAGCLVDAAARQPPGHLAWSSLLEVPAWGLLGAVMPAAGGGEVAFTSGAALVPGEGVVDIALNCGAAAAGGAAAPLPDGDQVPEPVRRDVPGCLAGVAAGAVLEELQLAAQPGGPAQDRLAGQGAAAEAGVPGGAATGPG